ncbi:MAG: hypothetical protein J6J16_11480 [Lachnospiraceae bacterium]|nr:hypothetical protein [Lachnospiraceae bacterium]
MTQSNLKLILFLLSVVMIGGVYMYVYKPNSEETATIESDCAALETRLADLKAKEANRAQYEADIVAYNEKVEEIVSYFPATLDQELSVMFIKGVEDAHDGEFLVGSVGLGAPTQFYTLGGNVDPETGVANGYTCYVSNMPISYQGTYDGIQEFIEYIMNYKYRMNISSVSITYDVENDIAMGSVNLHAYCVSGEGREADEVNVDVPNGVDNLFIGGEGAAEQTSYPYDADNGASIATDNNVKILLNNAANDTADGIIVSAGGEDTYVTSSENKVVAVNLAIEEQDDKIMMTYSIGDKSYSTEVTTEDVTIYVKSSDRVDSDDKNGVKLNVENTTDLNVFIKVSGDDATSPRFSVGRKLGTVVVY